MAEGRNYNVGLILGLVDNATAGLKKFTSGLVMTYGDLYGAVTSVINAGKEYVRLASESEKVETVLAEAMIRRGIYTEKAFKRNLEYANSIQKITTYDDENIKTVQAMLIQYGAEGEMVDKLTLSTLDFATAKGVNLRTAADLVAKTIGSTTNALTRYGIQTEGATGSTERMQSVVKNIAGLFGGAAQAAALTFEGRMKILQNRFNEIKETIGKLVLPIIEKLFSYVSKDILPAIENWISKTENVNTVSKVLITILQTVIRICMGIVDAFGLVGNGLAVLMTAMTGNFRAAKIGFEELKQKIIEQGVSLQNLATLEVATQQNKIAQLQAIEAARNAQLLEATELTKEQQLEKEWALFQGQVAIGQSRIDNWMQQNALMFQAFESFRGGVESSFSTMITNMATKGQSFGEAFKGLWKGIGETVIKVIADMLAKEIAYHTVVKLLYSKEAKAKAIAAHAGIPFVGLAIGLGVAAAVGAAIARLQEGVKNFRGGMALVGEEGPELVRLPRGSDVFSNSQSRRMLAGANGGIVINVTGNYLLDKSSLTGLADRIGNVFMTKVKRERNI